ncbi:MAG: hypothetical protein MZV65_17270 [Chromatiales bacterium]|nr:hypothetical protein [Chromatiales bacterium]
MPELRVAGPEDLPLVREAFCSVVEPLEVYNEQARRCELERYAVAYLQELVQADPRQRRRRRGRRRRPGIRHHPTRRRAALAVLVRRGAVGSWARHLPKDCWSRVLDLALERGYWKVCVRRQERERPVHRLPGASGLPCGL